MSPMLRTAGIFVRQAGKMSIWRGQDYMFQLQSALLPTGYEGENQDSNALLRAADAVPAPHNDRLLYV